MTGAALALVLVAAFIHAGWNYLLKKSGGGIGLLAAASAFAALAWAPIVAAFIFLFGYAFEPFHLVLMLGSAVVHTGYFLLLDRAYRSGGDLSIVYPLARATGPLLTIVVAVLLLGERPGPLAIGGALLIGASALLLTGNPFAWHRSAARHAVGFALLTGCTIAAYTVLDKTAVATWLVPPLIYDWGCILMRLTMMLPMARRLAPGAMARAWSEQRFALVVIGALSPLSYILVLAAMVFTPVSLVAPAREVSILFAALMGAHLLREGDLARRAIAAAGMVLGISGLALG